MRAAVLYEAFTPMASEEVSLDGPRDDEVLVQIGATGACHSDYHVICR
jgi:S-(hydroxymethyl)glutathione dehydrogenase / alcohol dehydrogenase